MSHISIFAALLMVVITGGGVHAQPRATQVCAGPISGDSKSSVLPDGFPDLGKWMIDGSGSPAHWLGEIIKARQSASPSTSCS